MVAQNGALISRLMDLAYSTVWAPARMDLLKLGIELFGVDDLAMMEQQVRTLNTLIRLSF